MMPDFLGRMSLIGVVLAGFSSIVQTCSYAAPTQSRISQPAGYVSPPTENGIAVKQFSWEGHIWNNDSGQAWNSQVPYAIGITDNGHVRFELRDTPNDRGQVDPPHKRRSEISSKGDKFHNHVVYWMAYSFKTHWDCVACQVETGSGHESMQVHWPSGASPPLAFRIVPYNGAAGFRITTRGDGQRNIERYTGPLALDQCHDVVFRFQLGAVGFEEVWLDGRQVSNLHNIPVGTDNQDGYAMRFGPYGGELNGNRVVSEYANIAPFPSTADLSARISRPPAC